MKRHILLLQLVYFLRSVHGLYFHVNYGTERCFFENVPEKALLSATYEIINDEARNCSILVTNSNKKVLLTKSLNEKKNNGRITHVSGSTDNYNVCVQCPAHVWYLTQPCKISLSIEIADASDEYGDSSQYELDVESTAKKHELDKLSSELSRFTASAMAIENHQISENRSSNKLYDTYKRMNRWILYFYLIEIAVICATTAFSVYHVTKFFKLHCFI